MSTNIKDSDARFLISCLLNGDSANVNKIVSNYMESAYSKYSREQTKSLLEGISSVKNVRSV